METKDFLRLTFYSISITAKLRIDVVDVNDDGNEIFSEIVDKALFSISQTLWTSIIYWLRFQLICERSELTFESRKVSISNMQIKCTKFCKFIYSKRNYGKQMVRRVTKDRISISTFKPCEAWKSFLNLHVVTSFKF